MAITFTENLGLPVVPADYSANWDVEYNLMMQKLDRNPGIRIVDDEAAMVALNVFESRMCWRKDEKWYWFYDGTQWEELPGKDTGSSAGGGMQDTAQETTASIAAGVTGTGAIPFQFYPGTGEEIMLLMLQVLPYAAFVSIADEAVAMSGVTEFRLAQKMADDTEVQNLVVKANTGAETPVVEEEKILVATTAQPLDNKNHDDTQVTVTAVNLDNLAKTSCVENSDFVLDLDGSGYTTIARAATKVDSFTLFLGGSTGGTFTLGDGLSNTAALAFDATAATIQAELEAIYGAGNVTVVVGTDFTITFTESVGASGLVADFALLTGATTPALTSITAYYVSNIPVVATAETHTLSLGGADGGTFDLGITGNMATLNWNDSAATIQAALEVIFGAGEVSVSVGTDFDIVFATTAGETGLTVDFALLTNATLPSLTMTEKYSAAGAILVSYAYLGVYILNTDYAVTVDELGTNIARIVTGSIGDPETVLVDYDYQPGVTGFKFRLLSKAVGGEVLYELDTSQDPDWPPGYPVRDPNFGYLPMCYYKNEDSDPEMCYSIENLDASLASQFIIDCKYKPLT